MTHNYGQTNKQNQLARLLPGNLFLLLILLVSFQNSNAQLVGWKYRDGINVHENAGAQNINYQVLLNINTASLVSAGKMNVKGNDIRFSKDCAGATLLNYFMDTLTMNTANTQIWVELDTLKASGNYLMYMWYGNSTAAAASNFNNTFPLSTQLVVPSGTVTLTGTNSYSWFEIAAGASVVVGPNSPFVINARMIKITGTLNGDGAGFLGGLNASNGSGPGGGLTSLGNGGTYGAGGASYGGSGGRGEATNTVAYSQKGLPGPTYGTLSTDSIDMGSGGAGAASGGGAGGAGINLVAGVISVTGTITANGSAGTVAILNGAGGGGSGGGIKIKGNKVSITGTLNAKGGIGGSGSWSGGGGGGGRIKIFSDASIINTAVTNVSGGARGGAPAAGDSTAFAGLTGTTSTGIWLAKEPTYSFTPHVVLTSSSFPICQGSTATFTASASFSPYKFYIDTALKQNSTSATFSTTMLNNNDTVKVLAGDAKGCLDTSNLIIVSVNALPTVSVTPATTICSGNSTPLSAGGGTSYNWAPSTGLSSTSGSNVTANPSLTTTYTVVVTGANSCQNWDTTSVTVDGCTGIQQNASGFDLRSYPNPNHGTFIIHANFGDSKEVNISLCNMLGETVKTIDNGNLSGNYKKEISISEMPDGIYFLNVKTKEGTQIKKIIKN